MRVKLGLPATALAIVLVGCWGCGGTKTKGLDRAQLISKADPICRRGNDKLKESKINPNNIARVAPGIAATYQQVSAELAKLTPPPDMVADWKVIVGEWKKAGEGMSKMGDALRANDPTAQRQSNSGFLAAQQIRSVIAIRNGFVDCGQY